MQEASESDEKDSFQEQEDIDFQNDTKGGERDISNPFLELQRLDSSAKKKVRIAEDSP